MRIRVLIVDDHRLVAEGLRSLLEANAALEVVGYCDDGLAAVDLALELKPDIVLMDMMMSRMNGIDATREIHMRVAGTQVIMVSMQSNPEYVFRALEAGAAGYLVKRAASRELLEAIFAVHAGRRFFSTQIAESVIERYIGKRALPDPLGSLSTRERQVLQLLAESKSVTDIALALKLSRKTIETYRARLFEKLGIGDLPALVRFAIQHGVISLE